MSAAGEFGADHQAKHHELRRSARLGEPESFVRRWTRAFDGPRAWGSVDARSVRHGVARYRLVVFPPGIDVVEQRLLRLWYRWPWWGAVFFVATQIILSVSMSPPLALVASLGGYLIVGAVVYAAVAHLLGRVRSLTVVRIAGATDIRSTAMLVEFKTLLSALCYADAQHNSGRWSPAAHEAIWWQVYDRLEWSRPRLDD